MRNDKKNIHVFSSNALSVYKIPFIFFTWILNNFYTLWHDLSKLQLNFYFGISIVLLKSFIRCDCDRLKCVAKVELLFWLSVT